MKSKIFKNLIIILILVITIFYPLTSLADTDFDLGSNLGEFAEKDSGETSDTNFGLGNDLDEFVNKNSPSSSLFSDKVRKLLGIIKYIGVILSVVILIIIGMKYMLGSVEQKADYKKTMMPYIYGTFFLFAGSFVPQLIYDIVTVVFQLNNWFKSYTIKSTNIDL